MGLPDDARPLDHLRAVLDRARPTWGRRRPLVLTHKRPDPDALGAMFGLAFLLRHAFGLDPETAATGRIFRAENLAMIRELGLHYAELADLDESLFGGVFLVDSQPGFGHTELPAGVPVVAVFDHHRSPVRRPGTPEPAPPHFDVRPGVGATSAMIYEYVRDAGLELDARTAAALCCGVRFDTADLSMHATPLDTEAFHETFRRADRKKLARINRPVLPASYYRDLHRSLACGRRYGPLVFGLLGRVGNPESVAEMADFFLRMEGCHWSVVGGAFERTYHLSLRTDGADSHALMEAVLRGEGSFGGRGSVAGGQLFLPDTSEETLRRTERRLRSRLLKLVDPSEVDPADGKSGRRLSAPA